MGCLKTLFQRVGCAVLVAAALVLVVLYRASIRDYYRQWKGHGAEVYATPPAGGAAHANATLERLQRRGGPAYEDLPVADVAALIEASLAGHQPRVLDSLRVALLEGEIRVEGSLDLSGVPRNLLGPLSGAVRDREPAAFGGPLSVDSAGRLVLTVTYLKLRDFPFPKSTIPRILSAARVPGADGARVPLPGAARLGDVRVSPAYLRAYRANPN